MSTPTEQARAALAAERFLRELAAREAVPTWEETRMAHALARRARAILRHLPTPAEWADLLTIHADTFIGSPAGERRRAMRDEFARESERRAGELRATALRSVAPKKGERR